MSEVLNFDVSDKANEIDQKARDLISDLILSWARYDSIITHWVIRSFGMGMDEGSIFIGNMDTKTKLNRIKALYKHFGFDDVASDIADLSKAHEEHADVRNTVCHKACAGQSKSNPERLIFAGAKAVSGKPGQMLVELLHLEQLERARHFAKLNADKIMGIVEVQIALIQQQRARAGRSSA